MVAEAERCLGCDLDMSTTEARAEARAFETWWETALRLVRSEASFLCCSCGVGARNGRVAE